MNQRQSPFLEKVKDLVKKPALLALLYFGAMTCVMTYPLIFHLNGLIGGAGGDGTYYVWLVRWYQKALFELHISPFYTPFLNYPQGWYLITIDITPAMVMLALPASLLFGPVVGYNVSMLLGFVLAGWGMSLWIRHLTHNSLAGLVGGTIYAFLPYHVAHLAVGHLNVAGIQWFPFYFWGLHSLLEQGRFSWKPVLLAAGSAALIALTSPYYLYMTVLLSAVFVVAYLIFRRRQRWKDRVFWKSLLAFGLCAGVLVGLCLLPYFDPRASGGLTSFPVEAASRFSASPTDFALPSVWHFLWGNWTNRTFQPPSPNEAMLYIGVVSLGLAVLAWVWRRKIGQVSLIYLATAVAVVAFILALGIDPHWLGQKVTSFPTILQPIIHRTDFPEIHLPAYYLFRFLPFFSKMRVMMRFGIFTLLFTSLLAGLGAQALLDRFQPKLKKWVTLVLLTLVFIDFYPGPFKDIEPIPASPTYTWLASQPDQGAVAIFPFSEDSSQRAVYDTLIYHKPFIGGHFNASHPEQYGRITPIMETFPSEESVAQLRQLGVAYVIVDSNEYANFGQVDQTIQALGLRPLNVVGKDHIYLIP
jgi:hypothetical protein